MECDEVYAHIFQSKVQEGFSNICNKIRVKDSDASLLPPLISLQLW